MCGRVHLSSDVSEVRLVFSIPPYRPTPNFAPSWNAAPTDPLLVVRYDPKARERSLVEEDGDREAALCHRAGGPGADGSDRVMGELALPCRRMGPQLRYYHNDAQRAMRRASQPDAGGPCWGELAGLAREEPANAHQLKNVLAPSKG